MGRLVREDWIVGGDFNAIIDEAEKERGRRKPRVTMDEFRDAMEELALVDIKTDNGWFMWVNNYEEKEAKDIIKKAWSRIDSNIIEKIEKVREKLGPWQHDRYRKMKNYIRRLVARIGKLIGGPYKEFKKGITLDINNMFAKQFTDEKILEAFNQMDPRKSLRIDGLSGIFFKEN
ncbi:hypothetical protein GOBAR_DD03961 [Gossypium barbadense]|nr:hypothetical protein GOBAR_DD03961 [Gossypium barbadense]